MKLHFKFDRVSTIPVVRITADAENIPEFVAAPIWCGCCGIAITEMSKIGDTGWLSQNWDIGHIDISILPANIAKLILRQSLELCIHDFADMMRFDHRTSGGNRSYSNEEHRELCQFVDGWYEYLMPKEKPVTAEDIKKMGEAAFESFFGEAMRKATVV